MRLPRPRRPAHYVLLGLAAVVVLACALVFHPAFQKKMLLKFVGPQVDALDIGAFHLTPWSLELNDIDVNYHGGRFEIQQGSLRFCPSSLLLLNLNLKQVALKNVRIDLQSFTPPAPVETPPLPDQPPPQPFPGVLAVLAHGLSYTLGELDVDATVRLPKAQVLSLNATGGGVAPDKSGAVDLKVRFDTGQQDDHVDLDTKLTLDQKTRGRFAALTIESAVAAALASLPETERADLALALTPTQAAKTAQPAAGGKAPRYTPESLRLTVRQNDSAGNNRSTLTLQGTYDGNDGGFAGDYRLGANERLAQPYAGDRRLPPAEEALNGDLDFNLFDLTGAMTVINDLRVSDLRKTQASEQLPQSLRLRNNFRLSLLPGRRLRVETLDSGLTDDAHHTPLTTKLPNELQVPLEDVGGFLHQENTLLEFELPDVPLTWFDALLPNQTITAGKLTGAFAITTDSASAIHLKPLKPLKIAGLGLQQADGKRFEGLNLSALPGATYTGDSLQLTVDKIALEADGKPLAGATLGAAVPLVSDAQGKLDAHLDATLEVPQIASLLAGEPVRDKSLPRQLAVNLRTQVRQSPERMRIDQLDASVTKDARTPLVNLKLQQPLVLQQTQNGTRLTNDAGTLATLTISDIRLDWFSGFVPDMQLKGLLRHAEFDAAAEAPGVTTLTSTGPVSLTGVSLVRNRQPLLDKVGVSLRPALRLTPDATTITYQDLAVTGDQTRLVTADGSVTLPGAADAPLLADGHLSVDGQAVTRQPLVADALKAPLDAPVRLEADYGLEQRTDRIDIKRLAARLVYGDDRTRLQLQADSGIRIRTARARSASVAGAARGQATLTLNNLTSEPFASILAARGLAFDTINGKAVLGSDGRALQIETPEPLVVAGVALKSADKRLINPFTLTAASSTTFDGDTLQARLSKLGVIFDKYKDTQALDGTVYLRLARTDDKALHIASLASHLTLQLPAVLDQPAILPDHRLTAGALTAEMQLDADGKLAAFARVGGLRGHEELALRSANLQVDGHLNTDGRFALTAPLTLDGTSGESNFEVDATGSIERAAAETLELAINSPVYYLNDVLHALEQIKGEQAETAKTPEPATPQPPTPIDTAPDTRAFWDNGRSVKIALRLDHLFYTDYLDIQNIRARLEFTPERLALTRFEAHFHDGPINADGTLGFSGGAAPYDLKFKAGVRQFDFARFFRELAPEAKPRAEGLFDVDVDAFGQSPNMAQYRNDLFFDARLHSGKGVFRLLDPDSTLVAGSSGLATGFGEVVSYLPTGLFGVGAVSRLVEYIREVEYNKIDIHLVRDASRDVQIKEYVVQSPEMLLTADGGIQYREGKDILQSPLNLDAQLNLRGKGAAIFYELGLLKSKQDKWRYWEGPALKFWGTPASSQSNLADLIAQAGRGSVLGGVTRPLAGLIGNIKYRWFGKDEPPVDFPTDKGQ